MFSVDDSISYMGMIQINGKKTDQIAREYGCSVTRVRQYAKEHDLPFVGENGNINFYLFGEEEEKAFANRNRKSTGRIPKPKVPKIPGKPGRPRKEKPVETGPKRPVGRPRKYPKEATDIVPKRPRGRPRTGE